MAKSTLFSYAVEEDEGKLVISISGTLAESFIRQIRAEGESGRGQLLARLVPIGSIYKAMSGTDTADKSAETPITLEQILGQNIDQSFSSFEQQIAELRKSISEQAT